MMQQPNHQQTQEALAAYLALELPATERRAIAAHLAECATCQAALTEAEAVRRLLHSLRADAAPPLPSLADAVMAQLLDDSIPRSSHPSAPRPVSGNARVSSASSNSSSHNQGATHAPRRRKGVLSPMEQPSLHPGGSLVVPAQSSRRNVLLAVSGALLLIVIIGGVFAAYAQTTRGGGIALRFTPSPTFVYAPGAPLVTVVSNNGTPLINAQSYASEIDPATPDQPIIPRNPTDLFHTGHYVFIVGNTNMRTKAGDVISIKWFFNDVDSTASIQQSKKDCCTYVIPASKAGHAEQFDFKLIYPAAARGKVELYYNGVLVITIFFEVVDP